MITLREPADDEEINKIICEPELFNRISEDGADNIKYKFERSNEFVLVIDKDGEAIGAWILHPENKTTLNIHCNILKEHREHGKKAGALILEWFVNDCHENYRKLNAEIPICYPKVYHYTRSFGFKDEGVNRKSIVKSGILTDQYRLGLTRQEAAKYLEV